MAFVQQLVIDPDQPTNILTATATEVGLIYAVPVVRGKGGMPANLVVQIVATGSPSAIAVNIDGSLDGVHFFSLADITSVGVYKMSVIPPYILADLTTLTGGTSPVVYVYVVPTS